MSLILCIESATDICSVAVSNGGQVIALKEALKSRSHTEKITVLIQECLLEARVGVGDLDAVAVSSGPGSYTSLRIGLSTAKGICFGQGIPLISIDTLQGMAMEALPNVLSGQTIIATIDARRMEVYQASFDHLGNRLSEDEPKIIDNDYLSKLDSSFYICGSGVEKAKDLLANTACRFIPSRANAKHLASIAQSKFVANQVEDLAYFVPNYIKPVRIIKSKKKLL